MTLCVRVCVWVEQVIVVKCSGCLEGVLAAQWELAQMSHTVISVVSVRGAAGCSGVLLFFPRGLVRLFSFLKM